MQTSSICGVVIVLCVTISQSNINWQHGSSSFLKMSQVIYLVVKTFYWTTWTKLEEHRWGRKKGRPLDVVEISVKKKNE